MDSTRTSGSGPSPGSRGPSQPLEQPVKARLQTEVDLAYQAWVHSPGEYLSVLDNVSDLEACVRRTGANATTAGLMLGDVVQHDTDEKSSVVSVPEGRIRRQATLVTDAGVHCAVYVGEFNNPWFVRYPDEFISGVPDAWMQDCRGKRIELARPTRDGVDVVPVPAVDDATILSLTAVLIQSVVPMWTETASIAHWIVGTEESYPELFGLPNSDFRPASLRHFSEWQVHRYGQVLLDADAIVGSRRGDPLPALWIGFREQAMVDRAASHMSAFLSADREHLVFYPTHGNLFLRDFRVALAQPPSLMVGATDGMEMGHITIDDDDERLNPLVNAHFASFGKPLINPRLANKTLRDDAKGGGRSFTPRMLRRLVYECVGQGVWHIGPIHWTSILHDGEWAIKGTPAEAECRRVFGEIERTSRLLVGMGRLQPQVGIFVSDTTWHTAWDPKWTLLFQDALAAHWNVSVIDDPLVDATLAYRTPLLISVDNYEIASETLAGMQAFLDAGGRLVVAGRFGADDHKCDAPATPTPAIVAGHDNVLNVDLSDALVERELVNEVHNGAGAAQYVARFQGVDFRQLAARAAPHLSSVVTTPIRVSGSGSESVNVFVLTDRVSLLAVLINNDDTHRSVTVSVEASLLADHGEWNCTDGLTMDALSATSSCTIRLDRYGTRLVWFHPTPHGRSIPEALEAIDRWKRDGFDTEAVAYIADQVRSEGSLPTAKRFSLARAICDTVALRASVIVDRAGAMEITVLLTDSIGGRVLGADVTMRITPGTPRRIPIPEIGDGEYRLVISPQELPWLYDAVRRTYLPVGGWVRLVFAAVSADGRQGGCIIHTELRE